MEFEEKAKMRIEHWMKHNSDHIKQYTQFADVLEKSDHNDAARHIREMAEKMEQCTKCLEFSLLSLDKKQ